MLISERLPQTKQTSCRLSLTTSHSAHKTAFSSATAFNGRPAGHGSLSLVGFIGWVHSRPLEVLQPNIFPHIAWDENGPSGSSSLCSHARVSDQSFLVNDGRSPKCATRAGQALPGQNAAFQCGCLVFTTFVLRWPGFIRWKKPIGEIAIHAALEASASSSTGLQTMRIPSRCRGKARLTAIKALD
jgi:hypothetical protein